MSRIRYTLLIRSMVIEENAWKIILGLSVAAYVAMAILAFKVILMDLFNA